MNATRLALLALLTASAVGCTVYTEAPPPPPPVAAEVAVSGGAVDLGIFYDGLGAYGEWIERPGYGRVWYPVGVRVGWRPYLYGRWVNSDYGWTWVSEEEFGWATYHYGRWYQDAEVGWVWVPGSEWGPAWVSFQQGGGYIGWAPLPPGVAFRAGIGIQFGGIAIAASTYTFCEERVFLHPQIATVVVPPARNVTIINNTTNITNYTVVYNRIVNQSLSVQHVEQATGQRVQRYQVAAASTKGAPSIQGNQLSIYKPNVQPKAPATAASQAPLRGGAGGQGASRQATGGAATGQQGANVENLGRRHQTEKEQLAARHDAERRQLQATHQQELAAAKGSPNGNVADLKRKHDAELRSLQQQHQKEQAGMEARHKQERAAAQGKNGGKRPPR